MIYYFYHDDYCPEVPEYTSTENLDAEHFTTGVLATHSKMYAMGEYYGVPRLKALALKKFELCFRTMTAGLSTAIDVAFSSMPDGDRALRQLIIDMLAGQPCTARRKAMTKKIRDRSELYHALYRRWLMAASSCAAASSPCGGACDIKLTTSTGHGRIGKHRRSLNHRKTRRKSMESQSSFGVQMSGLQKRCHEGSRSLHVQSMSCE
jgi:hypothetical protein